MVIMAHRGEIGVHNNTQVSKELSWTLQSKCGPDVRMGEI